MSDASSQLRSATRRAKSDVANKLVSMFLHELSRKISQNWEIRIGSEKYEEIVRQWFQNRCPYCSRDLTINDAVIEHLDGMNRLRAGLHVTGNVLVACKR
jgi:predicted transcriptional regulator